MKKEYLVVDYSIVDEKVKELESLAAETKERLELLEGPFEDYIANVKLSTHVPDDSLPKWREKKDTFRVSCRDEYESYERQLNALKSKAKTVKADKNSILIYNVFRDNYYVDRENSCMVRFSKKNGVISCNRVSFDELDALIKKYKGSNIIHKPAMLLLYQQEIKSSNFNFKPTFLFKDKDSANEILSDIFGIVL